MLMHFLEILKACQKGQDQIAKIHESTESNPELNISDLFDLEPPCSNEIDSDFGQEQQKDETVLSMINF